MTISLALAALLQTAAAFGQTPPAAQSERHVPQAEQSGAPVRSQTAPAPAESTEIGYFTAGQLADRCENSSTIAYCYAYVTAVHDTMRAYEVWLQQREFCVPDKVSQAELRRAFVTYLHAYPKNRSGQAASVIVIALKDSYPCPVSSEISPAPAERPKR